MAYRCPKYQCEATTVDGLVQQVAVSYLRHGYWWYVTGMIPERKEPLEVDENILTKYDIRKDWRFTAHRKARGLANLQYIRHGRFYVIMATKGLHEFKQREGKRIRDARECPILVPLVCTPRTAEPRRKKQARTFEGYAVSYRRGGYRKKTPGEREAYRDAVEQWKRQTANGHKLPRPPRGEVDPKWHSRVEIESQSYQRCLAFFREIAVRRSTENVVYELRHTPYVPWKPVKQQLVRIVKEINELRRRHGCRDQIPYKTVLGLRRPIVSPFEFPSGHSGDMPIPELDEDLVMPSSSKT